jgi:hypothetical protein
MSASTVTIHAEIPTKVIVLGVLIIAAIVVIFIITHMAMPSIAAAMTPGVMVAPTLTGKASDDQHSTQHYSGSEGPGHGFKLR